MDIIIIIYEKRTLIGARIRDPRQFKFSAIIVPSPPIVSIQVPRSDSPRRRDFIYTQR